MKTFHMTLLEADQPFFVGDCVSVQIPATDGAVGIMADHTNFICAIVPGTLKYRTPDGSEHIAAVSPGLCKVEDGDVLILTESAESPDEIDENRARREAEEAKEILSMQTSAREYKAARAKVARTMNRLKVKNKY